MTVEELLKPRYEVMGVVYRIQNIINGNFYIGSTINFNKRKSSHLYDLRKNKHHSEPLQRAFNKYKEHSFVFGVIEEVVFGNHADLLNKEQFYLDELKPEYNVYIAAGSPLGIKRSEEFKENASKRAKGKPAWNKGLTKETCDIIKTLAENHSNKMKGVKRQPRSDSTKNKLSEKRKGIKLSEEHRLNMKIAQQNRDPKTRNFSGFKCFNNGRKIA